MQFKPAKKLTPIARNLRKRDTWAEKLLWSWLRDRRFSAYKFRRQHAFGPHILDFFCVEAFLNVELDGSQHGYPEQQKEDPERDAWLEKAGVKVLRFWNSRLRREKEFVRETIWNELQKHAPHPLPDYCRPMAAAKNNSHGDDKKPSTFPSPRPSPLGRGRNYGSLSEKSKSVAILQSSATMDQPLNTIRETHENPNRPIAVPSPRGEGQGEGKRGAAIAKAFANR